MKNNSEFDLTNYLQKRKQELEEMLSSVMPDEQTRPTELHKAMRYAVFSGGKRIRPVLCMASCKAVCGESAPAMYPAMALEILHTYTLVHDDLPSMDNDDERRGKPTVHLAFGEANAILAGDALQSLAFELITESHVSPEQKVQLIKTLATAAGSMGVVGGQVADLAAIGQSDRELIRWIHQHKTADLFYAAAKMGGIAAGADNTVLSALGDYGSSLGSAFQITDDILDGSPVHNDKLPADETTCLLTYTMKEAKELAEKYVEQAHAALHILPQKHIIPLRSIASYIIERTI